MLKPQRGIQLDPKHPLNKGLVACWMFNERTGKKAFDLSRHGNDGTLTGALWRPSKFGGGLYFDGNGDKVTGDGAGIGTIGTGNYTISMWIYKKLSAASGVLTFDSFDPVWAVGDNEHLYIYDSGSKSISTGAFALNEWQMITYVRNGTGTGETDYYIEGSSSGVTTHSDSLSAVTTFGIAVDRPSGGDFDYYGLIDEVRIYNRALSALEIKQLYEQPFCMFQKPISPELLYCETGAPPATSIPALMNYYRQLRAA